MEELFWKLFKCNTSSEVHQIIQNEEIFKNQHNWHPYGGEVNNIGVVQAQSGHAIPALIEKITNATDAVFLKNVN